MKYATYRRVSTGRQAEDGLSLDAQTARLREYAESRGWTFVEDYCDAGVSGRRDDRPEFQRALADAEARTYDVLLVAALDRFGRGTRAALANFERLERADVKLVSLREQVDTTTPGGQFVRTLFAAFAEMESALIGERSRAGLDEARAKGHWTGGPVPTGYRINDDHKLEPDPQWQPVVRKLFDLALAGHAPARVARLVNAEGLRTRHGRAWTRRAVQNVLTNPVYTGAIVHKRGKADEEVIVENAHPAIVTAVEQQRVLDAFVYRDRTRDKRPSNGPTATRHALSRLAVCARCGAPMVSLVTPYKRKDGTQRRTYMCREVKAGTGLCDAPSIHAQPVDALIIERLPDLLNVKQFAEDLARERGTRRAPLEAALDAATGDVRRLDGKIAALERKLTDLADTDGFDAVLAALQRARDDRARSEALAADVGESLRAVDEAPLPGDGLVNLGERLADAVEQGGSMADLNGRLRAVLDHVELGTDEDGVVTVGPVIGLWAFMDPTLLPTPTLNILDAGADALLEEAARARKELEDELRRRGVNPDDDEGGAPARPEDTPPSSKGPQGHPYDQRLLARGLRLPALTLS